MGFPSLPLCDLPAICVELRATGSGKHAAGFSHYHADTLRLLPKTAEVLCDLCSRTGGQLFGYDAVKIDRVSRVSFLRYDDSGTAFPALSASLAVNLAAGTAHTTNYRRRRNPPILYHKKLLFPVRHPLPAGPTDLTARFEVRGEFSNPGQIGTVDGWSRALADVELALEPGEVIGP